MPAINLQHIELGFVSGRLHQAPRRDHFLKARIRRFLEELERELRPSRKEASMPMMQSRRRFITSAAFAGAASLVRTRSLHAELPPETTTVRLPRWIGGSYCWAAPYIAGELRAEGFTDVQYVQGDPKVDHSVWIAHSGGRIHDKPSALSCCVSIDTDVPIKVLAGLHSGCMELIANDSVRSIADLRGKRVGIDVLDFYGAHDAKLIIIIELDPVKDIQWVAQGSPAELFLEGKIDALMATPPARSSCARKRSAK